jgi:hypothetical protein
VDEARTIRTIAVEERRTISGYVLRTVMRKVELEERMFRRHPWLIVPPRVGWRPPGPRTTMLLRCAPEEGLRIRAAARKRDITISRFVLEALQTSWSVRERLAKQSKPLDQSR